MLKELNVSLPTSSYDFSNVREETYEECVMRNAGSGGTGSEDLCRGKPRQKFGLPEERVQYFLNNPEEAMPKSNVRCSAAIKRIGITSRRKARQEHDGMDSRPY